MTFDEIDGYAGVGFMTNVFKFVDDQLVTLNELVEKDMDVHGDSNLFGDVDYLNGIAFVAAQRYITSVYGFLRVDKGEALERGPVLHNGITHASVVNAAANYWKHSDEWDFDKPSKQQKNTCKILESIGVDVPQHLCASDAVRHKLGLRKFSELIPIMQEWSKSVTETS